jgi:hypothetical protein
MSMTGWLNFWNNWQPLKPSGERSDETGTVSARELHADFSSQRVGSELTEQGRCERIRRLQAPGAEGFRTGLLFFLSGSLFVRPYNQVEIATVDNHFAAKDAEDAKLLRIIALMDRQ